MANDTSSFNGVSSELQSPSQFAAPPCPSEEAYQVSLCTHLSKSLTFECLKPQVCLGLHGLYFYSSQPGFLLFLKSNVQLIEEFCCCSWLLCDDTLGHILIKLHTQQVKGWLQAGEIVKFGSGTPKCDEMFRIDINTEFKTNTKSQQCC